MCNKGNEFAALLLLFGLDVPAFFNKGQNFLVEGKIFEFGEKMIHTEFYDSLKKFVKS